MSNDDSSGGTHGHLVWAAWCGFFDLMDQEIGRIGSVRRRYSGLLLDPISLACLFAARMSVRLLAKLDGPRERRKSSELATFGWHMKAVRRAA